MTFIDENKNRYIQSEGLDFMSHIPDESVDCCFLDPQYRQVLDKLKYGNEGARQAGRVSLNQMSDDTIICFINKITMTLKPSSYLFLWVDKFILVEGHYKKWFFDLYPVDLITWNKGLPGQGYRSRRWSEYLLIYQKHPKITKNWIDKGIPDCVTEKIKLPRTKGLHPHRKPIDLMSRLISSTVPENGIVLDPCAGSFSTFESCKKSNRDFIGCDLTLEYVNP